MKYIFFIILSIACVSCTTIGSYDKVNLNNEQSDYVAHSMAKELHTYPATSYCPSGKPLFESFNRIFVEKGWTVISSDKLEFNNSNHLQHIRIQSSRLKNNDIIVSMKTPYFEVHQSFYANKDEIFKITEPTLLLKHHVQ